MSSGNNNYQSRGGRDDSILSSSIRKVSEDHRLRPFLSQHFDTQSYIKAAIKDGRSEECFADISSCISDANDEIKSYISQNKDDLMAGMNDVAFLAERYSLLYSKSQLLQRGIESLKNEALESYKLVNSRILELERIHFAGILLRQLRQFTHAKTQLDHHLKTTSNDNTLNYGSSMIDIRHLATAAKMISDLESLINIPHLLEIDIVAEHADKIRNLREQVWHKAHDLILTSLKQCNQAVISASLQVFFNLNLLPEILIVIIDTTVKNALSASNDLIDLKNVIKSHPDLDQSKSSSSNLIGTNKGQGKDAVLPVSSQLRVLMREISHQWSSQIIEYGMQIQLLQKVIKKNENPMNNILKVMTKAHPSMVDGSLLNLFWDRFASSLQDLLATKLKATPMAATRIYPSLRKGIVEVKDSFSNVTSKDFADSNFLDMGEVSLFLSNNNGDNDMYKDGMFGSVYYKFQDEDYFSGLSSLAIGCRHINNKNSRREKILKSNYSDKITKYQFSNGSSGNNNDEIETGLLVGLRPIRDRYLFDSLNRMIAPVLQMFPEMEGYTAAVPSKRDILTLIKALQSEFVIAIVEGEKGLLKAVLKEALKVLRTMIAKVEGMHNASPDSKKLSAQNSFARNSLQEYNAQLVGLLMQVSESLDKLPSQVLRNALETPGSSIISGDALKSEDDFISEIKTQMDAACSIIDEVACRHLLRPIVEYLANHVRSILVTILKEGVTVNNKGQVESSQAILTLSKQIPELIRSHLQSLTKNRIVTLAIEELSLRIMNTYITVVSLVQPMTEQAIQRIEKDMTTLENILSPFYKPKESCPINEECEAFKSLLHYSGNSSDSNKNTKKLTAAPHKNDLLSEVFLKHLRPSILLNYLVSSSPNTPIVYDMKDISLQLYIESLTAIEIDDKKTDDLFNTIRKLYGNINHYKTLSGERFCWDAVQQAMDILVQRIAVLSEGQEKQNNREWYEVILEIGGHFYS